MDTQIGGSPVESFSRQVDRLQSAYHLAHPENRRRIENPLVRHSLFIRLFCLIGLLSLYACSSSGTPTPPPAPTRSQPPPQPESSAAPPPEQPLPTQTAIPITPSPAATPTPLPSATPTAWQPSVSSPPRNIILIIVDTLRADHLSSYGYARPTTPFLDQLVAQKGARFETAISTAPWTCPSDAAMLTGRTPSSLGTSYARYNPSIPASAKTLAEYLAEGGYYTAGFATTYCVKGRLGFSKGFDYYDDSLSDRPTSNKARAEEVNRRAMDWLQTTWRASSTGSRPLFLFLYYFDPHDYYDPLPPYDTAFDPQYVGPLTPQIFADGKEAASGQVPLSGRDIEHLVALYDGEISYWDAQLGQMLAFLEGQGLMENTLLVVTADHGEQFGERGQWVHGNTLYQEVLRVPLLVRYDGAVPPGRVLPDPVQNYDLMPTILDWAGIPVGADVQARSLRGLLTGAASDPARPVFAEVDSVNDPKHSLYFPAPRISQYAVEREGWKLIYYKDHPELNELYRLETPSATEQQNVLADHPDIARDLFQELVDWFRLGN